MACPVSLGACRVTFFCHQLLPRVPKLYAPSAACPRCAYPNDEGFRFCQNCGYTRKERALDTVVSWGLKSTVDEDKLVGRMTELARTGDSSRYATQKTALEREQMGFLSSLSHPQSLPSALPWDVAFLIWKDRTGRTVVHSSLCPHLSDLKGSKHT